jgi:hypothetical protein
MKEGLISDEVRTSPGTTTTREFVLFATMVKYWSYCLQAGTRTTSPPTPESDQRLQPVLHLQPPRPSDPDLGRLHLSRRVRVRRLRPPHEDLDLAGYHGQLGRTPLARPRPRPQDRVGLRPGHRPAAGQGVRPRKSRPRPGHPDPGPLCSQENVWKIGVAPPNAAGD